MKMIESFEGSASKEIENNKSMTAEKMLEDSFSGNRPEKNVPKGKPPAADGGGPVDGCPGPVKKGALKDSIMDGGTKEDAITNKNFLQKDREGRKSVFVDTQEKDRESKAVPNEKGSGFFVDKFEKGDLLPHTKKDYFDRQKKDSDNKKPVLPELQLLNI